MADREERAIEEAREVLADGKAEIIEIRKVVFDKKTGQFSIKIPKNLALKANLDEKSEFKIVVHPKEDTLKSVDFAIIKAGEEDGEGESS